MPRIILASQSPRRRQLLGQIGLTDFEIRLRGKKGDDFNRSLSELKEKFSDVKIDIK